MMVETLRAAEARMDDIPTAPQPKIAMEAEDGGLRVLKTAPALTTKTNTIETKVLLTNTTSLTQSAYHTLVVRIFSNPCLWPP